VLHSVGDILLRS